MKKPIIVLVFLLVGAIGGLFVFGQIIMGIFDYIVDPPTAPEAPMSSRVMVMGDPRGGRRYYGFIDHSGKNVIQARFDDGSNFHEGLCAVRTNDHWGFINKHGQLMIPATFDRVHDFSEGLAAARMGRSWGFINKQGNWIVKPTWLAVTDYHHGIAVVGSGAPRYQWPAEPASVISRETSAIIDKSGKFVMQPQHCAIGAENAGVIAYCIPRDSDDKKFGYLNERGEKITDAKFEDGRAFSEGLAAVRDQGKWGFIDKSGNMIIPATFDHAGSFHNGLATAAVKGKFGIIDKSGKFVVQPAYGHLCGMTIAPRVPVEQYNSEGLMPVAFKEKWGFADCKTGKIVIKPTFWHVDTFSEGLARVGSPTARASI